MILVAIVEDDSLIRNALGDYINAQDNMACTIAKESVESFLNVLHTDNLPDVLLMDIGLPGMSGISGIKIIKDKYPDINCIMLTVYHDSHKIFQSLRAGASGYLLKNIPFSEIKEVITIVSQGGSFMSPQIARKVIEYFQGIRDKHQSPLTDKEKEIVMGLVDGMSYKKIADKSFISVETVRSHIKNIYKKLHVHSKAEVIKKSLSGEI
ncbi:LuxR family transcriptional regulator [Thermoplasmatales archaeon SG8-52-4]|nr:MAG: LuxR family transcriptional regulator [Thermoplasmatales archaeon SG8-52-4]